MTTDNLEKPRETFRRMRALAENDGATEAERDTARRMMAKYIDTYGAEVDIPDEEARAAHEFHVTDQTDKDLASHCASFTGCSYFRFGHVAWKGTKRERFVESKPGYRTFDGPRTAVAMAAELFAHHREKLRSLLDLASNVYRYNAMPIPSDGSEEAERSPEEAALMRAMQRAGRSNAMHRALPDGTAK